MRREALLEETIANYQVMLADGRRAHNDQFAGMWYDASGRLNVGITNGGRRLSRDPSVVYHAHRFSYDFLNEVFDAICALLPRYSIRSVGLATPYNRIDITISDENNVDDIKRHLYSLSLFHEGVLNVTVDKDDIHVAELSSDYELHNMRTPNLSGAIHAGERIHANLGMTMLRWGTLSAMATCNRTGNRGIITNRHVVQLANMVLHHSFPFLGSRGEIGNPSNGVSQLIGDIDAAFIPFRFPSNWQFNSSASYGNDIIPRTYRLANPATVIVGLPVVKFGAATGRTIGAITNSRAINEVSPGVFMTNQIRTSARAIEGDSGSPLFTIDSSGRHVLLGALNHAARDGSGSDASRAYNIERILNVTIQSETISAPAYQVITNATQFNNIRNNPRGNFMLNADIHLSGQWTPIHTFSGRLNGNGRTIFGMNITRPGQSIANDTHLGLISNLTGAVRDLTIRNSRIDIASNHAGNGWIRAGVLAGSVWRVGSVHNVRVESSNVIVHRERSSIGGVAGEMRGFSDNTHVLATEVWGNGDVGGIAGSVHDQGSIFRSSVGSQTMLRHYHYRNYRSVGGIAGFHGDGSGVIRNVSAVNVTIRRENRPGGPSIGSIIGHSADASRLAVSTSSVLLSTLNAQNVRGEQFLTVHIGRAGRSLLMNVWDEGRGDDISMLCERCSQKDPADVCANCADCIAFRKWYRYVNGISGCQWQQVA